jgi:hypothetical protein
MTTTSQSQEIGTVSATRGEVFAKGEDGTTRQLHVGDTVYEGEIITTATGGALELATRGGALWPIEEQQTVALDAEVSGRILDDTSAAVVMPLLPSEAATVIQALVDADAIADPSLLAGLAGGGAFVHLLGLGGGDAPSGGPGADTFAWHLGEQGAPVDHITGWGNGGFDVLNLGDVLHLDDPATLTNYLHFSFDGAHTTLEVKAGGGGFASDSLATRAGGGDQVIVFENADLIGSLSNQAEVINALLGANKLIVD